MEIQNRFYVLEKIICCEPAWYTKELQGRKQLNYVHNILSGDRFASAEEAVQNAPDDMWKPVFVNWFCSCEPSTPKCVETHMDMAPHSWYAKRTICSFRPLGLLLYPYRQFQHHRASPTIPCRA